MIPKPLFYHELLPFLKNYQYALILDEDISLVSFDLLRYQQIHKCSWFPNLPPLISQGLIAEETQYYKYLLYSSWKNNDSYANIVMTETTFIEQQAPFFHALFLEWFIQYVMEPTFPLVRQTESAWGIDNTWCGAAFLFAKEILGYNMTSYMPCSLIIQSPPLHHNDGRTIKAQRVNTEYFKLLGNKMRDRYRYLYPSWYHSGRNNESQVNPLVLNNSLFRSYEFRETCEYFGRIKRPAAAAATATKH